MFQSVIGDKIICQSCNKPKYKYETEMMLSLPLVASATSSSQMQRSSSWGASTRASDTMSQRERTTTITFEDILRKFFEVEHLPKTELLHCDFCKKQRNVSKQTEICSLPKILVIHLKRFVFSEKHMDYVKNNDRVDIKRSIQLTSSQEKVMGEYRLYGIVHHYGTKSNGHYIADVRDMSKYNSEGENEEVWYNCDDETIRKISAPQLLSSTAYVLFYYKTGTKASRQGRRR